MGKYIPPKVVKDFDRLEKQFKRIKDKILLLKDLYPDYGKEK